MIIGILELNSKTKYGLTSRNVPLYLFRPLDTTKGLCIVGCSQKETTSNVLAVITVDQWEINKLTRGQLVEVIGKCGDKEAEQKALLYQYSIRPWKKWNKYSLVTPDFSDHRRVNGYAFNVDPEGCVDIDDAIIIGDDSYIYIVIANVSQWVECNKELFYTACIIGQTMYNEGKIVAPLLPFEEECSLFPGKLRYGVALKFKWDGRISDVSFEKISFVNTESFTYDSIYKSEYAKLLMNIASYLAETFVEDSHQWIEQCMIFYNCEAAKILVDRKCGLLRSQNEPDIEKLEFYKSLGVDLDFLANKSAFYIPSVSEAKHWGFKNKYYCHATSPIRRFADIMNQLVLCGKREINYDVNILNDRGTASKKYEREMFFLNKVLDSKRNVQGVVLNDHRIWIPEWKRIITCKNTCKPGTKGTLVYSLDMNQSTWKRRMVFRFEDTNY